MRKIYGLMLASILGVAALAAIAPLAEQRETVQQVKSDYSVRSADTWNGLKSEIKNAKSGDTVELNSDITSSTDEDDRIIVDGKKITIDLKGHKVTRNMTSSDKTNGHVFEIKGDSKVTIKSSIDKAIITGGHAKRGGGINIHEGSTLTLENINIKNNKATIDGGGIYNRGTLIMKDSKIEDNYADDTGGGIYNNSTGNFDLDNVTIKSNSAINDGGGMNIHMSKNSSIKNSTFESNSSKAENGGALSFDDGKRTLSIYKTTFSHNTAHAAGGAIDVEDGRVNVYACTFTYNSAYKAGAVYIDGETFEAFTYEDETCEFTNNSATTDGGAIFNDNGYLTIHGGLFEDNGAWASGGAIRHRGKDSGHNTVINGVEFKNNFADEGGGAIYFGNGSDLIIDGASFTGNTADDGGAILVTEQAGNLKMKGAVTIKNNTADYGENLYLRKHLIEVTGSLEGSEIYVSKADVSGVFTKNFGKNNPTLEPDQVFKSDVEMYVLKDNGEAMLTDKYGDEYIAFPFISQKDQVEHHKAKITSKNWMSGISGERYLNEISIPGTHDTAMRRIGINEGFFSNFDFGNMYAKTQYRYIPEQYEEGVRLVDIRINTEYAEDHWWHPFNTIEDDDKNLWQCHGKDGYAAGTYWAADEDNDLINLNMTLKWTKNFLTKNPTETIIMEFTFENPDGSKKNETYERLYNILKDFIKKNPTNPSTGNPYVYLEDGVFGKKYTRYPQLKEVRGMICLMCMEDARIGGFNDYNIGGVKSYSQSVGRKVKWDEKLQSVENFYYTDGHPMHSVPKDGSASTYQNVLYKIGLNLTPMWHGVPTGTPLGQADELLPRLFAGLYHDVRGKYLGWIRTDGATEYEWKMIWKANYPSEFEYCYLTVNPGIDDPSYISKTYTIMKNTEIRIPNYNYVYDQAGNKNYFQNWVAETASGSKTYLPGEPVTITEDMTFAPQFANTEAHGKTRITVEWKDVDDKNHFRPSQIDLKINVGTDEKKTVQISESDGWTKEYNNYIFDAIPSFDKINIDSEHPYGTDGTLEYRYEIKGNVNDGYTITLIHTPNWTIDVFSGYVYWHDEDDYDEIRPEQVRIAYYGIDKDISEADVMIAAASYSDPDSNEWSYGHIYAGDDKPQMYKDGEELPFNLILVEVDEGGNIKPLDLEGYTVTRDGHDLHITHNPSSSAITASVRWADDLSESRPDKAYVHLFADGEEFAVKEVNGDENVNWSASVVHYLAKKGQHGVDEPAKYEFSVSITSDEAGNNEIEGYTPTITMREDGTTFDILMVKDGYDVTASNSVIAAINQIGDYEYSDAFRESVTNAKTEYNKLSESDQSLIYNYSDLIRSENDIDEKYSVMEQYDMLIESTFENIDDLLFPEKYMCITKLYNEISEALGNDMTTLHCYSVLQEAYVTVLEQKPDYDEASDVETLIAMIGEVELTNESKLKIEAARTDYDALTPSQKAFVGNYSVLTNSEANYFALCFLDKTGAICSAGGESGNNGAALAEVWNAKANPDGTSLVEMWNELNNDTKSVLIVGTCSEEVSDFLARYTHIMSRYSNVLTAFTDGPAYDTNTFLNPSSIRSTPVAGIVIAIVVSLLFVSIAGIAISFMKKHKQ